MIQLQYNPREHQQKIHDHLKRFNVLVCHRRFGKTVLSINSLIRAALTSQKIEPRFAYIAPFFNQVKDIAWSYLKQFSLVIPGTSVNESELRIDFPNGSRIRLYGADNPDRLRGIYLDGIVFDEYANMNPRIWSEIIRPALSDRQGWSIFIGTPNGENNFFELYQNAVTDPEWYAALFKASETNIIDRGELDSAKRTMTPEEYEQEYECSFSIAAKGTYYSKEFETIIRDGRITNVPYDPVIPVYTAWDLGIGDSTSIWFAQFTGNEIRIIDFYENNGQALNHYIKVLKEKPYIYQTHFAPHDIEVRELGSGLSRLEISRNLGIIFEVCPNIAVIDGINAVRMMLATCWFDKEKCKQGLIALRSYKTEYDEKKKVFKKIPLHDWSSHASDALRYLALSYRKYVGIKPQNDRYSKKANFTNSWMGG